MQKISIRLEDESVASIDSFAVAHGMSRAAATEFFVKLGLRELTRKEQRDEVLTELNTLKTCLADMHATLYHSSAYLALEGTFDATRFESARATALKSKREIFNHD